MSGFTYATSHRIEIVEPGLLRKDLSEDALIGDAADAKPALVHDPCREPAVYRHVLGPAGVGPRCIDSGRDWIVVEYVDAPVLWQVGNLATWVAVAAWVAGMHRRLASVPAGHAPLVVHDASLLAAWRDRAAAAGATSAVLAAHERASDRLLALPATVVHGELYASNILVNGGVEVWPVDWELAGLGPAVLDVAALTAGSGLPRGTRVAMARAYFDAAGRRPSEWPDWCADLDAARLHLCVQWLGWAPGWSPPAGHRHDWLGEATLLAGRL
ncbi:MAG: phosphotransferase family protein [Acidimicrobiales bacterium]